VGPPGRPEHALHGNRQVKPRRRPLLAVLQDAGALVPCVNPEAADVIENPSITRNTPSIGGRFSSAR